MVVPLLPTSIRAGKRLLVAAVVIFGLGACSTTAPPFDAEAVVREWMSYMQSDYVIRPGDRLALAVYQNEDLAQEVVVSPRGTVTLDRLPDEFRAAEKSISQFRREVEQAYNEILVNAEISIALLDVAAGSIYIAGEVRAPGVVPYVSGMLISQAVSEAGGLNILANWNDVRVLRNTAGSARTFRVNLSAILFEGSLDFPLLPGDVVFCQTSAIADVGNWVELYIRRLLPFGFGTVPIAY